MVGTEYKEHVGLVRGRPSSNLGMRTNTRNKGVEVVCACQYLITTWLNLQETQRCLFLSSPSRIRTPVSLEKGPVTRSISTTSVNISCHFLLRRAFETRAWCLTLLIPFSKKETRSKNAVQQAIHHTHGYICPFSPLRVSDTNNNTNTNNIFQPSFLRTIPPSCADPSQPINQFTFENFKSREYTRVYTDKSPTWAHQHQYQYRILF